MMDVQVDRHHHHHYWVLNKTLALVGVMIGMYLITWIQQMYLLHYQQFIQLFMIGKMLKLIMFQIFVLGKRTFSRMQFTMCL